MKTTAEDEGSKDVLILTTQEVRAQLKVIAALTRSTMKDVLARLVADELKRVEKSNQDGKATNERSSKRSKA
jgi:hypothetical protein